MAACHRAFCLGATANMRTGGDDVRQGGLALSGARPLWEETYGRRHGFLPYENL